MFKLELELMEKPSSFNAASLLGAVNVTELLELKFQKQMSVSSMPVV